VENIFNAAFLQLATAISVSVIAIVELLKRLIGLAGFGAVLLSIFIAGLFSLVKFGTEPAPFYWICLWFLVILKSNGIFKVIKILERGRR